MIVLIFAIGDCIDRRKDKGGTSKTNACEGRLEGRGVGLSRENTTPRNPTQGTLPVLCVEDVNAQTIPGHLTKVFYY